MIECKVDVVKDGYVEFKCPKCSEDDVVYIRTPKNCYACGYEYNVDIGLLTTNIQERIKYYFKKE